VKDNAPAGWPLTAQSRASRIYGRIHHQKTSDARQAEYLLQPVIRPDDGILPMAFVTGNMYPDQSAKRSRIEIRDLGGSTSMMGALC
jgi:hypothetical protein